MNPIIDIITISKFEFKTLLRSWFFRIFALLSILLITFFNVIALTSVGGTGWQGRMLFGGVPYFNLLILNVVQAIVAVFLSSDFLSRDKKLDTSEVFYVRSLSNFGYVFGKTLAVLGVFGLINLIVLVVGVVMNLVSADASFGTLLFVYYPLLISLPTLVFILGLSFFMMTLIRNQAITFLILLGYIGTTLFYLAAKFGGVFDYIGFFTPMVYSDFSGFAMLPRLLLVRGGYLLLGSAFIFFTIWRLPRLPQEKAFAWKSLGGGLLFFALGIGALSFFGWQNIDYTNKREEILTLNEALPDSPGSKITAYNMRLEHQGSEVLCRVDLVLKKKVFDAPVVLYLNPGFKIQKVLVEGEVVAFTQNNHLVQISQPPHSEEVNISMEYKGSPDRSAFYPDVEVGKEGHIQRFDPLVGGQEFAFVTNKYVLLTREAAWYPIVASKKMYFQTSFATFHLKVKTLPQLTVLSQGKRTVLEDDWVGFTPETALSKFSLVIGNYQERAITVDSVEYKLITGQGHDYFKDMFSELPDTLPKLISNLKGDFERNLGLDYPFKRFSVVEVPAHFYSYIRSWSLATENTQPEMVFLPEMGIGLWDANFTKHFDRIEKEAKKSGEETLPLEKQTEVFNRFAGNTFTRPAMGFSFFRSRSNQRNAENLSPYSVFPLYYCYSNAFEERGLPLLSHSLESMMAKRVSEVASPRGSVSLSEYDKTIIYLKEKGFDDLLKEDEPQVSVSQFVVSKGNTLFARFQQKVGYVGFNNLVDSFINANRFAEVDVKDFETLFTSMEEDSNAIDFKEWIYAREMPGFLVRNEQVYEFKDGDRIRYFLTMGIANLGESQGVVKLTCYAGRGRGGSRGGRDRGGSRGGGGRSMQPAAEEVFLIEEGKHVEVGVILDKPPRMVRMDTYLAKNVPSNKSFRFPDFGVGKDVKAFKGVRELKEPLRFSEDFEIIVDNEDEGFSVANTTDKKTLKDWVDLWQNKEEESYGAINSWHPPAKWTSVIGGDFYGQYIYSAVYRKGGEGNDFATWTAELTESGNYEVYAYMPSSRMGQGRKRDKQVGSYVFQVFFDDGVEEVEVEPEEQAGWVLLGEYYCSKGKVQVRLSDKSERKVVVADAVKWVQL